MMSVDQFAGLPLDFSHWRCWGSVKCIYGDTYDEECVKAHEDFGELIVASHLFCKNDCRFVCCHGEIVLSDPEKGADETKCPDAELCNSVEKMCNLFKGNKDVVATFSKYHIAYNNAMIAREKVLDTTIHFSSTCQYETAYDVIEKAYRSLERRHIIFAENDCTSDDVVGHDVFDDNPTVGDYLIEEKSFDNKSLSMSRTTKRSLYDASHEFQSKMQKTHNDLFWENLHCDNGQDADEFSDTPIDLTQSLDEFSDTMSDLTQDVDKFDWFIDPSSF